MELNREQIIKALEICTGTEQDYYCTNIPCPYGDVGSCEQLLMAHSYKLIKELTAENEAWQEQLISQKDKSDKAYYELACEVEDLRAENERLRAEGNWISVKDKLPDNYRAVLVVCESTSISGGRLRAIGSYGGGFWSMADADGTMRLTKYMQYIVTHWMELPPIPKGE